MNQICRFDGKNAFLSNFYPVSITFNGLIFPSVENAFQAAKCRNIEDMEQFAHLSPGQAKRVGRKVQIINNWDCMRIDIMTQLVTQKFTKNPELKAKLLNTGDAMLIEGNTWHDYFWGICNGHGENHLGCILMKVRDNLKEQ